MQKLLSGAYTRGTAVVFETAGQGGWFKKSFLIFMEQDLIRFSEVLVNAGQRWVMLKMKPETIASFLNCTMAKLSDPTAN